MEGLAQPDALQLHESARVFAVHNVVQPRASLDDELPQVLAFGKGVRHEAAAFSFHVTDPALQVIRRDQGLQLRRGLLRFFPPQLGTLVGSGERAFQGFSAHVCGVYFLLRFGLKLLNALPHRLLNRVFLSQRVVRAFVVLQNP